MCQRSSHRKAVGGVIRQVMSGGGSGIPTGTVKVFKLQADSGGFTIDIPPCEGMQFIAGQSTNVRLIVLSNSEHEFILPTSKIGDNSAYGRFNYSTYLENMSDGPEIFLRDGPDGGIHVTVQEPAGIAGMLTPSGIYDVVVQLLPET